MDPSAVTGLLDAIEALFNAVPTLLTFVESCPLFRWRAFQLLLLLHLPWFLAFFALRDAIVRRFA